MSELSPVKRALIEQRRLKSRIEELEGRQFESIAVIGLGCRFPGDANNPGAFWRLLHDGVDAVSDIPADRLDVSRHYHPDPEVPGKIATRFGGYLQGIDQFDAHAFGISPREASTMDPQQRLLLEVTWEALEHAGCAPDRMGGTPTGVFVGIGTGDYLQQFGQRQPLEEIDAYLATGNAHSVAAGRISYLLGLHGPSLALDTACSSSLVAIHLACESLRARGCEVALAGGVGILLSLENYVSLSKARMMAPDGRCKAFDARADGFVRSEGCGMVVLKRLHEAQRDGDRILAVVRGTACNQDGRSNGITAPNGPAQQAVIRAALANARVAPSTVGYVETHGTGTVLGDPIEVESLAAVLGEGRTESHALYLGSVKTNIGHMEAAAGVGGFIKTVLALQHHEIPPTLHFRQPNPHIAWQASPYLRVPTSPIVWSADGGPRVAGVSAFGFSGTNVHLIVEEAPEVQTDAVVRDRPLHLLALSGRTAAGLDRAAADLAGYLAAATASLPDVCYSVNTGRAAQPFRAVMLASSTETLLAQLTSLSRGSPAPATYASVVAEGEKPAVLFAFRAGASPDLALARQLFETLPAFRQAIEECESTLRPARAASIVQALTAGTSNPLPPVLSLAIHYAFASLWQSWGVTPAAVIGEGVGECAAAVVAGVLTLDDALDLVSTAGASASVPSAAAIPMFSAASGGRVSATDLTGVGYWPRVLASDGGMPAASVSAATEGFSTVLDLGGVNWNGLLERIAELYVRGVAIDWRGFDRGYPRQRVDVPASPFLRQRFWFDDGQTQSLAAPSTWDNIVSAAARQAGQVPVDVELPRFAALWRELDGVTTDVVAGTVRALGLFREAGEQHTAPSAIQAADVLPMYGDLMTRWLMRLSRAGLLRESDGHFVADAALPAERPVRHHPVLDQEPLFRDYLVRCERALVAMARGLSNPLEVLFPDGSLETADFFYRHWGLARYFNGIVREVAAAMVAGAAGRGLRVLEVGGGTGGTTASILPVLPSTGVEYWFTDLSLHFFARAETSFARYPFVRYAQFDLDDSPPAQGIPTEYFDLVIAANSVHATRDLDRSIQNLRSLLAPGATLVLYEVTRDFEWFEMSWALVEGWQRHADALRGNTPLLSPERWNAVLRDRGFDRVQTFPEQGSPAEVLGHHIVIATRPHDVARAGARVVIDAAPAHVIPGASVKPDPSVTVRQRLLQLTAGEQQEELRRLVHGQVMRVMRLAPDAPGPSVHDRLMNIGVDSLMAVELQKALTRELGGAVKLPSTLIFDHPTIAAIAALLHGVLGLRTPAGQTTDEQVPVTPGASSPRLEESEVADLSDDEVSVLLLERLRAIGK